MQDILIVVDMQNDFIHGTLSTQEAREIIPKVNKLIDKYSPDRVFFTRDTHDSDYLSSQEGRNLPVIHCVKGTDGWSIIDELDIKRKTAAIDKVAFGSWELGNALRELAKKEPIRSIRLAGVCTDICIISNALLLKAALPEVEILVDPDTCAGSSKEAHENALAAMKSCQITIG